MTNQLYIAGQLIDIDDSQVIALTKQIADIGEIQSKQANLTNTFRTKDEKAVAFVVQPGAKTKYPYRFLPARLVQNGFEVIRQGNAVIKSAGEQGAEITIYWGNNDFFDRLNFPLSELNLTSLNHTYHRNSAVSQSAQLQDIFYPFIEYGGNSTYRYYDNKDQRNYLVQDISKSYPAIKVKRLWDAIFAKIGFTYSMTDNPVFSRQAMQLTTRNAQIQNKTPYLVGSQNNTTGSGTFWRFNHDVIVTGTNAYFPRSGIANATRSFINATGFKARFKFRLVLNIDFQKGADTDSLKFNCYTNKVLNNKAVTHIIYSTEITDSFFTSKVIEFELDLSTSQSQTDLSINQSFYMTFQASLGSTITIRPGSTFQLYDFDLPDLEIGNLFDVAKNMPDMTAYQFVQNIARQYGMIFDTKNRHVDIITYSDVLKSKTERLTFPFIPEVNSIIKEFNPGNYYQINNILYTEGVDNVGSFPIDNKTLKKQGDLIKIEFYLPGFIEKVQTGRLMNIPVLDEQTNKKKDFNVPPMFVVTVDSIDITSDTLLPAYSNGQTIPINVTSQLIKGTTVGIAPNDLSYQALQSILDDFVLFTVSVRMNEQEFYGLQMYKAYFVPLLKTYVYIQKISNFVKGKPVKITLVKI